MNSGSCARDGRKLVCYVMLPVAVAECNRRRCSYTHRPPSFASHTTTTIVDNNKSNNFYCRFFVLKTAINIFFIDFLKKKMAVCGFILSPHRPRYVSDVVHITPLLDDVSCAIRAICSLHVYFVPRTHRHGRWMDNGHLGHLGLSTRSDGPRAICDSHFDHRNNQNRYIFIHDMNMRCRSRVKLIANVEPQRDTTIKHPYPGNLLHISCGPHIMLCCVCVVVVR